MKVYLKYVFIIINSLTLVNAFSQISFNFFILFVFSLFNSFPKQLLFNFTKNQYLFSLNTNLHLPDMPVFSAMPVPFRVFMPFRVLTATNKNKVAPLKFLYYTFLKSNYIPYECSAAFIRALDSAGDGRFIRNRFLLFLRIRNLV